MVAVLPAAEESVLIRDFENVAEYRINNDNGDPAQLTLDASDPREGKHGLRVAYVKGSNGWLNVTTPALLAPCVEAIALQVRKTSSDPDTALHVWLIEKDGNSWLSKPVPLAGLPAGWTTVRVLISDFSLFRGNKDQKKLDHRAVDRLMVGFNYGGCVVTLDDLRYTGEGLKTSWEKAMKLHKTVVIDAKQTQVANFLGFGGEWDPKFFTMGTFQNTATDFTNEVTVTEADWQLSLKRLRWMRPPIVRVMMCFGWCHPRGTWSTNTVHMRSLYRHLDFCQEQGIEVILTEWGIGDKQWLGVPGVGERGCLRPGCRAGSEVAG
jgi:hypothetical protein